MVAPRKRVTDVRRGLRQWGLRLLAVAVAALGAYLVVAPLAVLGWQFAEYYRAFHWVPVSLVSKPPLDWAPSLEIHNHDAWRSPATYRFLSGVPYWCLSGVGVVLLGVLRETARRRRRPKDRFLPVGKAPAKRP